VYHFLFPVSLGAFFGLLGYTLVIPEIFHRLSYLQTMCLKTRYEVENQKYRTAFCLREREKGKKESEKETKTRIIMVILQIGLFSGISFLSR